MSIELNYLANLGRFVPELIASLTMVALIFVESTYDEEEKERPMVFWVSMLGLFTTAVLLYLNLDAKPVAIFTGSFVVDSFSTLSKLIMVLGTMGAIYISRSSKDLSYDIKSEFAIISLGVLVGGMLLASANNMLILYIGIETLSILSYVLASLNKNDERSSEAGLKYSLYGGISAGIMLFGMSHIFGVLGTIQFTEIIPALKGLETAQIAILMPSFLLFFVGIGYKIACVPFHMWTPDVYEGSPIPVTTFFSIVPKIAGIAVLLRVTFTFFNEPGTLQYSWVAILQVIAALTMTVGNVAAIGQRSVKRMLAYSSISHAGMMILGAVVVDSIGPAAVLFYGFAYLFMTLVAFYITSFVQDKYGNDHFERFNGLIFKYPLIAILMSIVMFSLAGIPPMSGFVAKFNILAAVVNKKLFVLAIIAGLNSVVSLYYYLKIVRLMVLKPSESDEQIEGFSLVNKVILTGLGLPVVLLGIYWSKLYGLAQASTIYFK